MLRLGYACVFSVGVKMGQPQRIIGVKGDECNCGRRASVIHCPRCGSSRVYSRLNRKHRMINGEDKFVETQFRCQACSHLFIEEEREWCDAPPITAALALMKQQRLHEASKTNEYLAPNVIAKAQELAGQEISPEVEALREAQNVESSSTINVVEGE